jgi:hypothetical protein
MIDIPKNLSPRQAQKKVAMNYYATLYKESLREWAHRSHFMMQYALHLTIISRS